MKQAGNALFLILIAVALFAALSYAVTQSGRGGGSIDREEASISAAQIVQTVGLIQSESNKLALLNGIPTTDTVFCTGTACILDPDEITFPPCTTGSDCIFAIEGGSMPFPSFPDGALDSSGFDGAFRFHQSAVGIQVQGLGTIATEPYLRVTRINEAACREINRGLGLGGTIPTDSSAADTVQDSHPGEPMGCFELGPPIAPGSYEMYAVFAPQ